jgi:hypothetical protein
MTILLPAGESASGRKSRIVFTCCRCIGRSCHWHIPSRESRLPVYVVRSPLISPSRTCSHTYGPSKTACIDQTSRIFDLMQEAIELDESAMAFSRASNMTFIATMVSFIALCHEGSPNVVDDLCHMVRRGIMLLKWVAWGLSTKSSCTQVLIALSVYRRVPPTGAIGKAADLVLGMLECERSRRCLFIDHEVERESFDVSAGNGRDAENEGLSFITFFALGWNSPMEPPHDLDQGITWKPRSKYSLTNRCPCPTTPCPVKKRSICLLS